MPREKVEDLLFFSDKAERDVIGIKRRIARSVAKGKMPAISPLLPPLCNSLLLASYKFFFSVRRYFRNIISYMQQKTIKFRPNFPVGLLFSSLLFFRTPYHYFFEDHGPHIVSFLFQICIDKDK
jgi:hypothetical protein